MSIDLKYNSEQPCFSLFAEDAHRLNICDLSLKFRLTTLALQARRVRPDLGLSHTDGCTFPLRLWGMGSAKILPMHTPSMRLTMERLGRSHLFSIQNDVAETCFSADEAVSIALNQFTDCRGGVAFHNRSNEFQNFDCEGFWWSQVAFSDRFPQGPPLDWGLLSFWTYQDGLVAGALPVTGKQTLGWFKTGAAMTFISSPTVCPQPTEITHFPVFLLAFGDSVNAVTDALFDGYAKVMPDLNIRTDQDTPSPFDKLGWCSWNAFGKQCTEDDLLTAAKHFSEKSLPVKYMIIDDCWQDYASDPSGDEIAQGISASKLNSLAHDRDKFPGGIKAMVDTLKATGIETIGLWHALNGYWQGFHPASGIVAQHPEWFIESRTGRLFPAPDTDLFDHWYQQMKAWGIGFVKVDNQGYHRQSLAYQTSLPAYMAALQNRVTGALNDNAMSIIYCMATHPENIYNAKPNQWLRVSNDFIPNDGFGARLHIVNNFYNSAWLAKLFRPDFDMFQSSDINAETFARMLALSESPIYTTDEPDRIRVDLLKRLALPDGKIPRYDSPARIVPSRFFENPYEDDRILAVTASTRHALTLGLFNVVESGKAVSGQIAYDDIGLDDHQRYFVWSDRHRETSLTDGGAAWRFALKHLQSDLITFSPIRRGFAAAGIVDYFAAPTLVEDVEIGAEHCTIRLLSGGKLLAYSQQEPRTITDGQGRPLTRMKEGPAVGQYACHDGALFINTDSTTVEIRL